MKKQVVIIGGGHVFPTYDAYISHLKKFEADGVDYFRARKDWKTTLQETLGDGYDVLIPQMPNKDCARYREWKIWLEKTFPFIDDDVILVGHSLGASFLAKYLQEELHPISVRATFLVAGTYGDSDDHTVGEFSVSGSLTNFRRYGGTIHLYHSMDDPIVPFSELDKYLNALKYRDEYPIFEVFKDRGHFNQETFPELVADIKKL